MKHNIRSFLKLIKFSTPVFYYALPCMIILSSIGFVFRLFEGLLLRNVANVGVAGTKYVINESIKIIIYYTAFALILILVDLVLSYFNQWLKRKLKYEIISHFVCCKETYAKDAHSGDIMTRLHSDTYNVSVSIRWILLWRILRPIVSGIGAISVIWIIDYRMAVVALFFGFMCGFATLPFSKKMEYHSIIARKAYGEIGERFSDILAGSIAIRLFNAKNLVVNALTDVCNIVKKEELKQGTIERVVNLINSLFNILSTVIVIGLGLWLSARGEVNFPDLMVVITMISPIAGMVSTFAESYVILTRQVASIDRIFEIIESPIEEDRSEKKEYDKIIGDIEFSNVSFTYNVGSESSVLNNVTFCVPQGKCTALVGLSGSGKSTIFQLLLNYYDIENGKVSMNGVTPNDTTLFSWRKQFAYVEQNSQMLDGSIRENIAFGAAHREVSDEEIIEAAKSANAHNFIMKLEHGYNSQVGELGSKISGGERQRIAIARAFLSGAPVLLLDEPTSSLDNQSEALVQEALDRLKNGKTVIVAAHRLSTVKNADEILVLDNGSIIERGSHDELIENNMLYTQFWKLAY